MKRIVLDTNVLVSFLTDRDPRQQARAAELFTAASRAEVELVLHQIVATELVYVLRNLYRVEARRIAATIGELLALPGLLTSDDLPWAAVLDLWPATIPDFADAVLVAGTRAGRHDAIATFDLAFRRRLTRLGFISHW